VNFWNNGPGINYRLSEFWIGKKAEDLGFEKYALASGLLQAEGLTEYISNYRRRMFSSSSAIFWMFNDSWPVTHGWTIVDYYLRKKLAFFPVARAFKPVTTVVALENDSVKIFGVNDSPVSWNGTVRYGVFRLSGGMPLDKNSSAAIPSNTSVLLASFPAGQLSREDVRSSGAFSLLEENGKIVAQYRLFTERFKNMNFLKPVIKITRSKDLVTFISDVYVWGACIDTNGERKLSDNCFDLLPGIPYTIPWRDKENPRILFTGNDIFL
jgi:beta-mannosidase